jgi:hypothetical protein
LSYGATSANHLGQLATLIGLVALVVMFVIPSWRRRRGRRNDPRDPDHEPGSDADFAFAGAESGSGPEAES